MWQTGNWKIINFMLYCSLNDSLRTQKINKKVLCSGRFLMISRALGGVLGSNFFIANLGEETKSSVLQQLMLRVWFHPCFFSPLYISHSLVSHNTECVRVWLCKCVCPKNKAQSIMKEQHLSLRIFEKLTGEGPHYISCVPCCMFFAWLIWNTCCRHVVLPVQIPSNWAVNNTLFTIL